MKKLIRCLSLLLVAILLCTGCTTQPGNTESTTVSSSALTEENPSETEPAKGADYTVAYEGYYNEETRVSQIEGTAYLNLFQNRIYYTTPGTLTHVPLEGDAQDWVLKEDKYEIVELMEVQEGRFMFKASKTGYVYVKNATLNKTAKIYVNKPCDQKPENKKTNDEIPYYLYLEKGSYTNFQDGSIALTVYRLDDDGYYTIPYLTICTACGAVSAKTPIGYHTIGGDDVGKFTSNGREFWHNWGGSYSQYTINYESGVYIHSVLFAGKNENGLSKDSLLGVGKHASGGCLRMQTGSAYWIWTHCPNGTTLEIVDGNPRGACIERNLGHLAKGYDPTDPYLLNPVHHED